jgi:hypothetical protein
MEIVQRRRAATHHRPTGSQIMYLSGRRGRRDAPPRLSVGARYKSVYNHIMQVID